MVNANRKGTHHMAQRVTVVPAAIDYPDTDGLPWPKTNRSSGPSSNAGSAWTV